MSLVFIFEDKRVRTVIESNRELFHAGDVVNALGYKANISAVLRKLDEDERVRGVAFHHALGGMQETNFITESGVYHLAFKSNLKSAKRFRKWITNDVIPSIRKHGGYHIDPDIQKQIEQLKLENANQTKQIKLLTSNNTQLYKKRSLLQNNRLGSLTFCKMKISTRTARCWYMLGNSLVRDGTVKCEYDPKTKKRDYVVLDEIKTRKLIRRKYMHLFEKK